MPVREGGEAVHGVRLGHWDWESEGLKGRELEALLNQWNRDHNWYILSPQGKCRGWLYDDIGICDQKGQSMTKRRLGLPGRLRIGVKEWANGLNRCLARKRREREKAKSRLNLVRLWCVFLTFSEKWWPWTYSKFYIVKFISLYVI